MNAEIHTQKNTDSYSIFKLSINSCPSRKDQGLDFNKFRGVLYIGVIQVYNAAGMN